MNKVNRFLLMLIAMAAIMLMAVGVDKGMKFYEHKKWESEREVYYEEARTDIAKMQATLQTLSEDQEALVSYLEEYELNEQASDNSISENRTEDMSVSDNNAFSDQFFGNQVSENDVSGNTISGNQISGNEIDGQVSGN